LEKERKNLSLSKFYSLIFALRSEYIQREEAVEEEGVVAVGVVVVVEEEEVEAVVEAVEA
jgi:hypothetical protein